MYELAAVDLTRGHTVYDSYEDDTRQHAYKGRAYIISSMIRGRRGE
jgi:hypothetical protein